MNKSTYWRVLKYSVALTLGGCAILPNRQPVATVEPMFRVSNSPGSAYGYFLLGAYYSGQRRNEKAAEAYRQALQLDPEMVEAHNALAIVMPKVAAMTRRCAILASPAAWRRNRQNSTTTWAMCITCNPTTLLPSRSFAAH